MANQTNRVISELRDLILKGKIEPGKRLAEVTYADLIGVSRTPLRLAFAELEKEGLLEKLGRGGYKVRTFSIKDIADAVDVRGALEGMAVRLITENGLSKETLEKLESSVNNGKLLIKKTEANEDQTIDAESWRMVNLEFHEAIIQACKNEALIRALNLNNNAIPFVSPQALTLTLPQTKLETSFVAQAQADHEIIFQAMLNKESSRAEFLMKEHAYKSRENKRKLIAQVRDSLQQQGDNAELGPAEVIGNITRV